MIGLKPVSLILAAAAVAYLCRPDVSLAQTDQGSMKQSCAEASRAFALRDRGIDGLTVAEPGAAPELREAALHFYHCAQREQDPYLHDLFLAYYANTLYRVARVFSDPRALSLAETAARPLRTSTFDEIRALVAAIPQSPGATKPSAPPAAPSSTPSVAYCREFAPNIARALDSLGSALTAATDAGRNDTQVLLLSTARYGSAFKAVEDDFATAQGALTSTSAALTDANLTMNRLTISEQHAATKPYETLTDIARFVDSYTRLALIVERAINNSNRRLAWARAMQGFSSGMSNRSYTYSNGNASCYAFTAYSASCYGSSMSTTTYDNSATIAQQRANAAVADAEAGRLSYQSAAATLSESLSLLEEITPRVYDAEVAWSKACGA